jgi:hypothetical protein
MCVCVCVYTHFFSICKRSWGRSVSSVVTTDWMTRVRSPAEAKDLSSSLCAQTSSEAHLASYPKGTGGKMRPRHDTDHSPHLVPRSRMSRSYNSSPLWCLHCVEDSITFTLHLQDIFISCVILSFYSLPNSCIQLENWIQDT